MLRTFACSLSALVLCGAAYGANLVANPSFECSTAGWMGPGSAGYAPGVAREGNCEVFWAPGAGQSWAA